MLFSVGLLSGSWCLFGCCPVAQCYHVSQWSSLFFVGIVCFAIALDCSLLCPVCILSHLFLVFSVVTGYFLVASHVLLKSSSFMMMFGTPSFLAKLQP